MYKAVVYDCCGICSGKKADSAIIPGVILDMQLHSGSVELHPTEWV
jgi:hypothetical protein